MLDVGLSLWGSRAPGRTSIDSIHSGFSSLESVTALTGLYECPLEPPALPAVLRPRPLENQGWVWVQLPQVDACLVPAGECSNKECPFLHIDPESKIKDCPWYDRGFCKHGRCGVAGPPARGLSSPPLPTSCLFLQTSC